MTNECITMAIGRYETQWMAADCRKKWGYKVNHLTHRDDGREDAAACGRGR